VVQFSHTFMLTVDCPVDAFPRQGTIQAGYLKGLKTLVLSRGADPRKFLEHHDIDPLSFDKPDYNIECAAAVNLLEYCSGRFEEPLFGLRLAEQQDPDVFGCAMTLARAAPSFRQALQSLVDYVPVTASPECEMELVTAKDTAELRWRTHTGLGECEQPNYQGLLLIMKTLQVLGAPSFRPRYATLTFKIARSDMQPLQERVGCRISGSSEAHAIAFPADMLDRPIATSNKILFNVLGSYLAQLRSASRAGFVEQVEAFVRGALPNGHCTVDACAGKIGTSARTLQKRLTRMDVKFSDIVQKERVKLAKQALLFSESTLDEIAFQLGYSEQTSFGRAFKRSTGVTPQAFRQAEKCRHHASPEPFKAN
jgi:AraC-like DNA-binding protein